jgi:hypothetical protein
MTEQFDGSRWQYGGEFNVGFVGDQRADPK